MIFEPTSPLPVAVRRVPRLPSGGAWQRALSRARACRVAGSIAALAMIAWPVSSFAQSASNPPAAGSTLLIVQSSVVFGADGALAERFDASEQVLNLRVLPRTMLLDSPNADESARGPSTGTPGGVVSYPANRVSAPSTFPPVRVHSAEAENSAATNGATQDGTSAESIAPLLEQLSAQTQALHQAIAASLVRVHWPDLPMADAAPAEELLRKWEQRLEPSVKQKLLDQIAALRAMRAAAAQGNGDPFAALRDLGHTGDPLQSIDPLGFADLAPLGLPPARPSAGGGVTIGLVVDDRGLLVVPEFVDRERVMQRPIFITLPGGGQSSATFVGSDRPTGLTVLRLVVAQGRPARLSAKPPADGAIVMAFAGSADAERLALWRGGARDADLVALTDGRIAGFETNGQFLSADDAAPVIQQLADTGVVRRPALGIRISPVQQDDPRRRLEPLLGDQPAMHIEKVQIGSAADRGGLKPGDYIVAIQDKPVSDVPTFAALIAARSGPTEVHIIRDGAAAVVNVDLVPR